MKECLLTIFVQMFKLFDEDGNGNISIQELLSMMAFFIEVNYFLYELMKL